MPVNLAKHPQVSTQTQTHKQANKKSELDRRHMISLISWWIVHPNMSSWLYAKWQEIVKTRSALWMCGPYSRDTWKAKGNWASYTTAARWWVPWSNIRLATSLEPFSIFLASRHLASYRWTDLASRQQKDPEFVTTKQPVHRQKVRRTETHKCTHARKRIWYSCLQASSSKLDTTAINGCTCDPSKVYWYTCDRLPLQSLPVQSKRNWRWNWAGSRYSCTWK
jgi:hypothetical protein